MDSTSSAGSAPLPAPPPEVEVWDPLVRVFHWSLVGLFALAYATGDDAELLHLVAGYGILSLLLLRVLWGFIGPRHARFADFVKPPRVVLDYLALSRAGRAPRHLGHNPAGGAMVVALLVVLGGICLSGHLLMTDSYGGLHGLESLHELLVNLALGLVVLHVAGNLFSSRAHGESLTWSMITGRKRAGTP
ncbi:cytochrome b/b6 domain-containing protein [Rhodovastum atsumiense]|nr:cytochrome b/b6 domain-containing protein [Rhodovastum atsumiense]